MIWYSHVNEDNRAERELLLQGGYDQVICVTGSGERALALMDVGSLRSFHTIDINPEANYLLELKLATLKQLGERDYLASCGLLGERPRHDATTTGDILESLSPSCRDYWRKRMDLLLAGVAHCGHFERFLGRIRPMLQAALGKSFEECFVRPYNSLQKFPFKRWNFLLRLFSQRWIYLLMGNRDPAFVAPGTEPFLISRALQKTLEEDRVMASFMFHLIFRGALDAMPSEQLPPSLRKEVLEGILLKLREPGFLLQFHEGDLKATVAAWPMQDFSRTFFSISDILSFADFDYLLEFLELLNGEEIAVVFRSFLRHGLSRVQMETLENRFKRVADISQKDQSRMYSVYHVLL